MSNPIPLQRGQYYHIYNRGNNREGIFVEERNYRHFLRLYARHIEPVADTFAYCLLSNHFHLLVHVKDLEDPSAVKEASQCFSNLFNAYAKGLNKAYDRTGALFQRPFGRIPVSSDAYFVRLVTYVHQNPEKHGLVDDFRSWAHSSYHTHLSDRPTRLQRDDVLAWFGGREGFRMAHDHPADMRSLASLVVGSEMET
jgi:putative transposase